MKQNAKTNSKVGEACRAGLAIGLNGASDHTPVCLAVSRVLGMFTNTIGRHWLATWNREPYDSYYRIQPIVKCCILLHLLHPFLLLLQATEWSRKKRRRRTMWIRPLFQKRLQCSAYNLLMAELRGSDTKRYQGFTCLSVCLSVEDFDELLSLTKTEITGTYRYRLPIPADIRLVVTLRYLATGTFGIKLLWIL